MTGDLDAGARRAEVNEQFADHQQREDAAAEVGVRNHPFDWWDLFLFVMPIAIIVFAMWSEAE